MCGICGVVTDGAIPDRDVLGRMLGRLLHRGPDGSGLFCDRHAALGHSRLAIIDVAGGAQPLCNEDESLWIAFNGEIFNYVELREELVAGGHAFRTSSDTEVIVHAWEEWGEDAFARFNGQWALALWDRRARRLVLSRDRLGIRPLYYSLVGGGIVFASEVKALFAHPGVRPAWDPAGLDETFTYWSCVAPRTVFEGVRQLEPGHLAVFEGGHLTSKPYWGLSFPARGTEPHQDIEESAQGLRERIVEATRLRFVRSDVPVGAYLSGGIDSSVTAAVIAEYTDAPLHTFSLRFQDTEYDEGTFQQRMSAQLGTRHEEVMVSTREIGEVFPDVVLHAETPLVRAAPAPLFLLSRLVRDSGFKVVVTGEGADEVLGGYDIYREARVRRFWANDPGSEKRARATELLYPWMSRAPAQAPAFARGFFGMNLDSDDPALSHRPRWGTTAALKGLLTTDTRALLVSSAPAEVTKLLPADSAGWDPLARAQWLEMTTLLAGYVLASQGDRMLMANSVEGRFPFLDRDVVEYASNLPARHKLLGLEEKYVLKRAFADLVPAEIIHRPKQPVRAPDAPSFFFDAEPDWIDDVTSPKALEASGLFEPRLVAGLFAKCRRTRGAKLGNTDNMRVVAVLSAQLLHQQFILGGGRTGEDRPVIPDILIDLTGEREFS